MFIPTRKEIIEKIKLLQLGRISREEMAIWADLFVLNDNIKIDDNCIKSILDYLSMITAINPDGSNLYTEEDFSYWLLQLNTYDFEGNCEDSMQKR